MSNIVIRRVLVLTQRVPFDSEWYPDCETAEDAVKYERDLDREDKIQNFFESNWNNIIFEEQITVED